MFRFLDKSEKICYIEVGFTKKQKRCADEISV